MLNPARNGNLHRRSIVLSVAIVFASLHAYAGNVTYGYDNAGRLRTTTYSDGSSVSYTLDASGNRKIVSLAGPDSTPPSPPASVSASAPICSQVNLSWPVAADNAGGSGIAGYNVYRGGTKITAIANASTSGTASYGDTGLTGSTTYSYAVGSYDLAGNPSSTSTAAAPITTPAAPAPQPPSGIGATATSNTQVHLAWSAPLDPCGPGIGGYKIYRGLSTSQLSFVTSVSTTTYNDAGLTGGATYYYTIASYDALNALGSQSAAVPVTTPANVTDTLTMTVALLGSGGFGFNQVGYSSGQMGQLSPTTLTGGKLVSAFYDIVTASGTTANVVVSGFSSDPGKNWLWSASALGITKSGASAGSYGFSNGAATWYWSNAGFGFTAANGTTTPVTLTHP